MPGYKQIMRFLDNLTGELSRRSVARALPFLRRAWHVPRSALVIMWIHCSLYTDWLCIVRN